MASEPRKYQSDVVVVGGGLAGIVTASELLEMGKKVLILERDKPEKFGGLAKESFGGIMMVNTSLQRKTGIKDSPELALSDWESFAEFSKDDLWPKKWAETYVNNSIELIYSWLTKRSIEFLPIVNWPERGMIKRGNSVPRWHIVWGTGYGLIEAIVNTLNHHGKRKNLKIQFDHCVNELLETNGRITGCAGVLEGTDEQFESYAELTVIASGGICGGDLGKVRENWHACLGRPPKKLLNGSHIYADGKMHDAVSKLGGNVTHLDKQWHYAAGIHYPNSECDNHGLSLVPPRSALWVNAVGKRIGPPPLQSYTDTRYLVEQICREPGQFSWQILNWKIAIRELAVSGGDYMYAFRNKKKLRMILNLLFGNRRLVNRLLSESNDFVVGNTLRELVDKMNQLEPEHTVDYETLSGEVDCFDREIERGPDELQDEQLRRILEFRKYRGDRLRVCKLQKILENRALPLIAIREFILTRKSLGGIQTDLLCRVLDKKGEPIPGLLAVGEAAGFGGGGINGLRSLEGTFLGGCVLTGRMAGKAIASGF